MANETPKPDTPPVPPSPLGQDPPKNPPAPPPGNTPPSGKENTPPAGKGTQYTQEQIDAIQEKAANYDIIQNDPELVAKVMDHYKAKLGKAGNTSKAPTPPVGTPEQNEVVEALKVMSQRLAETTRVAASQELKLFQMQHPDMHEFKDDMAKLVKQYGMPLEEAYRFSKLAKAQEQKPDRKAPPVVPTSETNESAGEDEERDTTFEEVEKQINDPKATPHMDDAILKAYLASKKLHASSR